MEAGPPSSSVANLFWSATNPPKDYQNILAVIREHWRSVRKSARLPHIRWQLLSDDNTGGSDIEKPARCRFHVCRKCLYDLCGIAMKSACRVENAGSVDLLEDHSTRFVTCTRTVCSTLITSTAGGSIDRNTSIVDPKFDDYPVTWLQSLCDTVESSLTGELYCVRNIPSRQRRTHTDRADLPANAELLTKARSPKEYFRYCPQPSVPFFPPSGAVVESPASHIVGTLAETSDAVLSKHARIG